MHDQQTTRETSPQAHPHRLLATETLRNLEATSDEFPYVTGVVELALHNIATWDHETFLDTLSEELVGSDPLMETTYAPVGVSEHGLTRIEVTGDVSAHLDNLH